MNDLMRPAMYEAWHGIVPVGAAPRRGAAVAGRGRRPGLRERRHLRPRPDAAAPRDRRHGRIPRCRRLRCGDVIHLQCAPAGAGGAGGRRPASPWCANARPMTRCCTASACRSGSRHDATRRAIRWLRASRGAPGSRGSRCWWEAAWPALWPPLGVVGLFLVVALSGLPLVLPPLLHLSDAGGLRGRPGLGRAACGAAARPARRRPRPNGASNAIPAWRTAPSPRSATGPPATTRSRWRCGRRIAAAPPNGSPRCASRRRSRALPRATDGRCAAAWRWRWSPPLVVAGPEAPERLRRALLPAFAGAALPTTPSVRLEAWITPPAYTGAAPIFLDPAGGAATVPAGSRLQVAVSGGAGGVPDLLLDGAATPFRTLDRGSFAAETAIECRRAPGGAARWHRPRAMVADACAPMRRRPSPGTSRRRAPSAAWPSACPGGPRMTGAWRRCAWNCA